LTYICGHRVYRFCFIKLSLLLIAIEARNEDGTDSNISINPGPELKLDSNSQGFFIAESADDVKRYLLVMLAHILVSRDKKMIFILTLSSWKLEKGPLNLKVVNCELHLAMNRTIGLTGYIGPLTLTLICSSISLIVL